MDQTMLGSTGTRVGRVGLGTSTWGRSGDHDDARLQLQELLEAGGNLVHTADHFCDGAAQQTLGKALADVNGRESAFLVSASGITGSSERPHDTSRRYLLDSLDAAVQRLQVDHLDLWMICEWDDSTPVEETLATLEMAVSSGRSRYAGVCHVTAWQVTRYSSLAGRIAPISCVGARYSLVDRSAEVELIPAAEHLGIGLLAYAPLGLGVLTGKYRHGTPPDSRGASQSSGAAIRDMLTPARRGILDGLAAAADGLAVTPGEVALAWLGAQRWVTSAVVGARNVQQLRTSLRSAQMQLPEEILRVLDEVSSCTTVPERTMM